MINFDNIKEWAPCLTVALAPFLSKEYKYVLSNSSPEYFDSALSMLFEFGNRDELIDATLAWLNGSSILAFHGTRLTENDVKSIEADGLIPLSTINRKERLIRALSVHKNWPTVSEKLDSTLHSYGKGQQAGRRVGQVHFTLSDSGLRSFDHYLTAGSEFDQHVAHALLGDEGVELLEQDGVSYIICVKVPGHAALEAGHPHFNIDQIRQRGDLPNLVREFLYAWSYWISNPDFNSANLKTDCGMVFKRSVKPDWIVEIRRF